MSERRIERVARAICKSRTCEGFQCCEWPAQMGRKHDCPVTKGYYNDAARAAIEAMGEPDANGWLPIETAPRDGTPIIGYWEGYKRPCVMWWNFPDEAFESWTDRREDPSHWIPLPPKPPVGGGSS